MRERSDTIVGRLRTVMGREWRPPILGLAVVGFFGSMLFRVWRLHPRVPVVYQGDAVLSMSAIRNISLTGWYSSTDLLGVPYGQNLLDFPAVGDFLHLVGLRFLVLFTDSPGLILNVFYFATFATVFLGAFAGCRLLAIRPFGAAVVAVLYTFLPFHTLHGPSHLFLSSYGAVPLWVALAVRQMGDEPLIGALPGIKLRQWHSWLRQPGHAVAIVVVVLGATTGLYYAVFMTATLLVAGLVGGLVHRSRNRFAVAWGLAGLGGFLLTLQFLPTWSYQRSVGSNAEIVERGIHNIEYYSLKLTDLVLPVAGHRIDWMAELRAESQGLLLRGEQAEAIGLVGVVGLTAMVLVAVVRMLRGHPGGRHGALAVVGGTAFVMASVGGLATVVGIVGFTYLRAWGRISVVVAFCGLCTVGIALEHLKRRQGLRPMLVLGALIVVIGVLDTNPQVPFANYDDTAANWSNDEAFVRDIETQFGVNATIFQLPIIPFPEHPPVYRMVDYDHLRGYLHSDTLGWSYGGVKGRMSDWQQRLVGRSPTEIADGVALVGFDAIWVDRFGYGPEAAAIESALGQPNLRSPDGRHEVYDLRARRGVLVAELDVEKVRRRIDALLESVTASYGKGFHGTETAEGRQFAWAPAKAAIDLSNPTSSTRHIRLSFFAASAVDGDWQLTLSAPSNGSRFALSAHGASIEVDIEVPADGVTLNLESNAPRLATTDPRDIRFRVFGPIVTRPIDGS